MQTRFSLLTSLACITGMASSCSRDDRQGDLFDPASLVERLGGQDVAPSLSLPQIPLSCLSPESGSAPLEGIPDLKDEPLCRASGFLRDTYVRRAYREAAGPLQSRESDCMRSVACMATAFDALSVPHPAASIVHSMDRYALNDMRSLKVFHDLAGSPLLHQRLKDRRLDLVYPGSGSHLPPLITAFELIDQGRIDAARLVYTEVDPNALERIRIYLDYWRKSGVLTVLKERQVDVGYRNEFVFTAIYEGRLVQLVFSMVKRFETPQREKFIKVGDQKEYYEESYYHKDLPVIEEELWAPLEYVENADLIVLHDGPGLYLEELHRHLKLQPRPLILDEPVRQKLPFQIGRYQSFNGFFGCHVFGKNEYQFPMLIGDGQSGYRSVSGNKRGPNRQVNSSGATVLQSRIEEHLPGSGEGGAMLFEIKSVP